MPKNAEGKGRVVLDGFQEGREPPSLTIHVLDDAGKTMTSVPVEGDGTFPLDALRTKRAARIMIGPSDANVEERRKFFSLPGATVREMIKSSPEPAIGGRIWQPWLGFSRCVSGNVRRCFPFLHRAQRRLNSQTRSPSRAHRR